MNVGIAHGGLGDVEQNRLYMERALELGEKIFDPDHPSMFAVLGSLASLDLEHGEYGRAAASFARIVASSAEALGPDHWRTLQSELSLADDLLGQGEVARAGLRASGVVERAERELGPGHWVVVLGLGTQGDIAYQRGDIAVAKALHERALELALAISPDGYFTVSSKLKLARSALAAADLEEAEHQAGSALQLAASGSLSGWSPEIRTVLAAVAYGRGDFDRAEALSREALASLDGEGPDANFALTRARAAAHLRLGQVLSSRGDVGGAHRNWRIAAELMEQRQDGVYAQTLRAIALLRLGQVEEARPIARQTLRGNRSHELIELCERYGVEVPPLAEETKP